MLHDTSPGNCKLKQQDSTTHLLEWPKPRTMTTPNADKDVEQQEISFIAKGNAKGYSHFGKSLSVSYKTKGKLQQSHSLAYIQN